MNKYVAVLVLGIVAGALAVYQFRPPEVRVEVQEKEIVRTDTKTVTRVVERPDGTKETVIESTDKSVSKATKSESVTKTLQKNWNVAIAAHTNRELELHYSVHVQRRVLGPFYAGVSANTIGMVGLSLGMEF